MATATKAAAIGVFIRFFDVAADRRVSPRGRRCWRALAAITIIVGNVGALAQTSTQADARLLRRRPGRLHAVRRRRRHPPRRVRDGSLPRHLPDHEHRCVRRDHRQERESGDDQIGSIAGLGARNPGSRWPLTVAMLGLAGIPGTAGFIGKFQLIHALVDGNYTWLAIVLVIGAMISLGYYLRVVAAIWMGETSADHPRPPRPRWHRSPGGRRRPTRPASPSRAGGGRGRRGVRTPTRTPRRRAPKRRLRRRTTNSPQSRSYSPPRACSSASSHSRCSNSRHMPARRSPGSSSGLPSRTGERGRSREAPGLQRRDGW